MNERIKQLRLLLNLTQEEFGKKLGVTRSAISYIESGRSKVTEQMVIMICTTFNVRKSWLKTGTGDITDEDITSYMNKLMAADDPEKEKYALIALKLIVDEWDLINQNITLIKNILTWISEKPTESQMPKP